jgi:hypothetical protein
MVFAILCEAAVRLETGRKSRNFDYVVYGDDIVIKSIYGDRLVQLLDEFGFTVNPDKSFLDDNSVDHHFREACGIEALDGEDITPLRISRRFVSPVLNDADRQAGEGVGIIDMINRCYLFHYWNLRRWLNDQCCKRHWYRRLFRIAITDYRSFMHSVAEGKPSWIRLTCPYVITDDSCDTQWACWSRRSVADSPIQRPQFKVTTASSRRTEDDQDGNCLFTWLYDSERHSSAYDDYLVDATGIVSYRPRDLKWSKTWVSSNR